MTCEGNVCGTGGWDGPQPGDPDNSITLSAVPAFGGIDIHITYPAVNPFAVAYIVLYRSATALFSTAFEIAKFTGTFYHDRINADQTYYYWVRLVSVNGTVGAEIGPASATARPTISDLIEMLTGQIDAGQLAIDLKTHISGITTNNAAIAQEIQDRILANAEFAALYQDVQNGLTQAITYIGTETTQRQDGDSALAQSISLVAAANGDALAGIVEERTARVTADSAMAQDITSLLAKVGDNTAGIVHDLNVQVTRTDSLVQDVSQLFTTVGDANSGLIHDITLTANAVSTMGSDITTMESALNGNVATGQMGLITHVGNIAGQLDDVSSEFFVKLETNGLVGGFGLYNAGATVDVVFDVDNFSIGRTGPDKKKPFIIKNSEVFIDQAVIESLVFTKLRADDGSFIVENGKLKANYVDVDSLVAKQIDVKSSPTNPGMTMVNTGIRVYYPNGGSIAVKIGSLL